MAKGAYVFSYETGKTKVFTEEHHKEWESLVNDLRNMGYEVFHDNTSAEGCTRLNFFVSRELLIVKELGKNQPITDINVMFAETLKKYKLLNYKTIGRLYFECRRD